MQNARMSAAMQRFQDANRGAGGPGAAAVAAAAGACLAELEARRRTRCFLSL